uniref:Uncharacterized protein n=1 Tax=Anguilla anguilla TaxID=7936 RepID=A0A0E9UFF7_ANGAN
MLKAIVLRSTYTLNSKTEANCAEVTSGWIV